MSYGSRFDGGNPEHCAPPWGADSAAFSSGLYAGASVAGASVGAGASISGNEVAAGASVAGSAVAAGAQALAMRDSTLRPGRLICVRRAFSLLLLDFDGSFTKARSGRSLTPLLRLR